MNLENTIQKLKRVRSERLSMQGLLHHCMSQSLEKRHYHFPAMRAPPDIKRLSALLLACASKERRLVQRAAHTRGIMAVEPTWHLSARLDNGATAEFDIMDGVTFVGRGSQCELMLPLPFISRQHLTLTTKVDGLYMEDTSSTNGTRVNGKLAEEALLSAGDTLTIAGYTFVVSCYEPKDGVFIA